MENNLNLYHIFYTVAKNKNISGAAKELYISQLDASREFLLKVIEIVCAGGEFHKQNTKKTGFLL